MGDAQWYDAVAREIAMSGTRETLSVGAGAGLDDLDAD
jgi:hypothetical protein